MSRVVSQRYWKKVSMRSLFAILLPASLAIGLQANAPQNAGSWETAFNHNQTTSISWNAIHMALIPMGKWQGRVLMIGGRGGINQDQQEWTVFDPETKTFEATFSFPLPKTGGVVDGDIFCSGHTWLPDGRLFVAGGVGQYNVGGQAGRVTGSTLVYLWSPPLVNDPGNGTWALLAQRLVIPRYYPTCTFVHGYLTHQTEVGPIDYVLVLAGSPDTGTPTAQLPDANSYEAYKIPPSGTPTNYNGIFAGLTAPSFPVNSNFGMYPRTHYVSNKHVGYAAPGSMSTPGTSWPTSYRAAQIDHDAWINAGTAPGNVMWLNRRS